MLLMVSIVAGLPIWTQAQAKSPEPGFNASEEIGTQTPPFVGADPVPDLSLPQTVMSSVQDLIGAGGIIQESPENITLYNSLVAMRLLGRPVPHDELLGPGGKPNDFEPGRWGLTPAKASRLCGIAALALGVVVAGLFVREAVESKDALGDLTVGALVEGKTIPMAYTLCYGIIR